MARNQIQNMGGQAHLNVHGLCWFASESLLKFEMLVSAGSFLRNKKCVHPRKLGLELALLHTFARPGNGRKLDVPETVTI